MSPAVIYSEIIISITSFNDFNRLAMMAISTSHLLTKVILGSKSITRHSMLELIGCKTIAVIPPDIDEYGIGLGLRNNPTMSNISKLVVEIATGKANKILELIKHENSLMGQSSNYFEYSFDVNKNRIQVPMTLPFPARFIITGDQVVTCNNRILEKPVDANELLEFYQMYSGSKCSTVGSIVITDTVTCLRVSGKLIAPTHFYVILTDMIAV